MEDTALQKQLLQQIRQGDNSVIRRLYKEAFHYCAGFVLENKGSLEDAREIFQESLLVLLKKVRDPAFEITYSLKAFLYAVTRNLWLKQLNKRNKGGLALIVDEPDKDFIIIDEDDVEEKKELEARHQDLYDCMKKLKEDCQKLLNLTFYKKIPDAEVAPIMDYSVEFVRQKRRRCIKSLKQMMAA